MVELAELLTERVDHADWAMFGKNGSDATRLCLSAARATTGRRSVVAAETSYHGWSSWSNKLADGSAGRPDPETFRYTYNDLDSVRAAVATIHALKDEDAVAKMQATGTRLREGIAQQADQYSCDINQSGPVQIPNLSFAGDVEFKKAMTFCGAAAANGAILHPRHNWFLSSAHTDADIDRVLGATDAAFRAVRATFGPD